VKIIITGSNGMLGSSLCQLYHNKHEVHAIHRDKRCYTNSFENYSLDLLDFNQLQALFNQINPDIVIHCAGLTSVDRCEIEPEVAYETNVDVSENIAMACKNKAKLIYISSDQVYGETEFHSETNELLLPLNRYGKTKLLGEQKIQDLSTDYLILRTNIFWWNVKPERISSAEWIYKTIKNHEEISLFSDYTFSPISTLCLGDIILQLLEVNSSGVINVGSSTPCSKYEFGLQLSKEFDFETSFVKKGLMSDHSFVALRSNKLDLNVSKLINLGITPPDLRHSMKIFAKHYKANLTLVNK
jgi:dTDP-4-dehydrorhamnose reductase